MKEVGHHIQVEALRRIGSMSADRFGRSAFNRYYYATFLLVREGLASMNPAWRRQDHAGIPTLLRGTVMKSLKSGRDAASRQKDADLVSGCRRAIAAANGLAKLLELANAARVTADYNPEISVEFNGTDRFSLNGVSVSEAHSWADSAGAWMKTIVSIWRQLHA